MLDGHGVVWWDPHMLELKRELDAGQRHTQLLADATKSEPLADYGAWRTARTERVLAAATPARVVESVTTRSARALPAAALHMEATSEAASDRPGGSRFGVLVHAVLASIALDADEAAIERAVAAATRATGAANEERSAAVRAVGAALRHRVFDEVRRANKLRRNAPIQLREDDGTLLEGVLDLAYRDADGWVVVDFKTDDPSSAAGGRYARQVHLYSEAIRRATGEAARSVLFAV